MKVAASVGITGSIYDLRHFKTTDENAGRV